MSSYSNPHIPKTELDALKETMTERAFQQEINAQFLEDGSGVFRYVYEAACLEPRNPEQGHNYVIGVDWARTEDSTVFCVLDTGTFEAVWIDRMNNTDFATQRRRLISLVERYNNANVLAERNSMGLPQIEELQSNGIKVEGFLTTNATKNEIINGLELAFEQRAIKIVKDDIVINELLSYESERLASGLVRYNAPEGMHDDCVIALAIAWYSASRPSWLAM
jgi:phage FluMu gp28-like protein